MKYTGIPSLETWQQDSKGFPIVTVNRTAAIREAWGTPDAQKIASAKLAPSPEFSFSLGRVDPAFKPGGAGVGAPLLRDSLKEVDAEIVNYHTAFTPMAKRNALNSLRQAIDGWSRKHPGLPDAMKALKEIVEEKLELRPAASRYTKAICIAFHFGCNYDASTNSIHNVSEDNTDYRVYYHDDEMDMKHRCGELWSHIVQAQAGIGLLANDPSTLKIFMAPEFYFRGSRGAYSVEVASDIIPMMRSLGTSNLLYKDWLFVFGTAAAAIELPVDYCIKCKRADVVEMVPDPKVPMAKIAQCKIDPKHRTIERTVRAEMQNVALIQHGADSHMVVKEYVSNIDYKNNKVLINQGKTNARLVPVVSPLGSENNPGTMTVHSDERMGGCVFTMDGLTIGLEVCLDHGVKNARGQVGRASKLAPAIQVLLIPSYGMNIRDGLFTKPKGILFNVDGQIWGSSEVKLNVAPYESQKPFWTGPQTAAYGPFDIPA